MERDKCFSSLLHSICEGLNSFFSSETQKKMCLMCLRKKPYLSPLFKRWPLANDFRIETEDKKVLSALCNTAPKWNTIVSCERQGRETRKVQKLCLKINFFRESVTCIHRSKFVAMQVCNLSKRVICEKLSFLHSLDVLIKMLVNSLTVLNQRQKTMGRIDHVHCFQTQLTESCLVFGSAQTRDSSIIGFSL